MLMLAVFCIFDHLHLATKSQPPNWHGGFILNQFSAVPQHTILHCATTPQRLIVGF